MSRGLTPRDPAPGEPLKIVGPDSGPPVLTMRADGGRVVVEYDRERVDDVARALFDAFDNLAVRAEVQARADERERAALDLAEWGVGLCLDGDGRHLVGEAARVVRGGAGKPLGLTAPCVLCVGGTVFADDEMLGHLQRSHPDHPCVAACDYRSSLCQHGLCAAFPGRCRLVCKWCRARCAHDCHRTPVADVMAWAATQTGERYEFGRHAPTEQPVSLVREGEPPTGVAPPEVGLLTSAEHRAMTLTGELFDLLCEIAADGEARQGDLGELAGHIHDIQHTVLSQAAGRAYPGVYRLMGGNPAVVRYGVAGP